MYCAELEKLTNKILCNIGYLVSEGIVEEKKGKNGKIYYKLPDKQTTGDHVSQLYDL